MARAPRAIQEAMVPMVDNVGGAVFSGIVGDVNHSYGYHLARNQLPGNDYSVQYDADRDGPDDAASALDISLPAASMTLIVNRLMDASVNGDPRLYGLREWFGARAGQAVTGWDFRDPSTHVDDRITTADDSHKWHIHLSGYRRYADDGPAWAAIADVFTDTASIGGALSEEDYMGKLTDDQLNDVVRAASIIRTAFGDQPDGSPYYSAVGMGEIRDRLRNIDSRILPPGAGADQLQMLRFDVATLLSRAGTQGTGMSVAQLADALADALDDDLAEAVAQRLGAKLAAK